jgi:uncharacterized membrane protein YkvA (DUF1232 family)
MDTKFNNGVTSIDQDYVKRESSKVTTEDVRHLVERTAELKEKFDKGGPLHKYWVDARLLIDLVRDYWNGSYRKTPWWVISSVAFALIYVLNPFDLVPDFIPLLGQLDDVGVLAACLVLIEQDLNKYKGWRLRQTEAL